MTPLPEEALAEIYERAGFRVQRAVGTKQGTIAWTASIVDKTRSSTLLFHAVTLASDVQGELLRDLEMSRIEARADHAVGVVLDPTWQPVESKQSLEHDRRVRLLSHRRWLLETIGVDKYVREFIHRYEQSALHTLHLPRRARINGEEVDATDYLQNWIRFKDAPRLFIAGHGKTYELLHAAYEIGRSYVQNPEWVAPVVFAEYEYHDVDKFEFPAQIPLISLIEAIGGGNVITAVPEHVEWSGGRALIEEDSKTSNSLKGSPATLELQSPSSVEIFEWFHNRITRPDHCATFRSAVGKYSDFATLIGDLENATVLLRAIRQYGTPTTSSDEEWLVDVVGAYVDLVLDEYYHGDSKSTLAKGAYESYRWGETGTLMMASGMLSRAARLWGIDEGRIRLAIVRDYLIGVHVVNVPSIASDDPLPLFAKYTIVNLAPRLGVQVATNYLKGIEPAIKRIEEGIAQEVAHRLQLTFQHILNRPVGMLRQSVQEIREGLDEQTLKKLASSFDDVDKQLNHLADLAQKIRLWQEDVEGTLEDISLLPFVNNVTRMFTERNSGVLIETMIDESIVVHAMDHALREVLYNLVENAIHAVLDTALDVREVKIRAHSTSNTVIIEIEDSGTGIPVPAQGKIFDPFHTTKKGGRGKPRGTGLGLAIVRKYVLAMGGRVELLSNRERTTFAIELIGYGRSL
jgi:signal transduction histidine kinase